MMSIGIALLSVSSFFVFKCDLLLIKSLASDNFRTYRRYLWYIAGLGIPLTFGLFFTGRASRKLAEQMPQTLDATIGTAALALGVVLFFWSGIQASRELKRERKSIQSGNTPSPHSEKRFRTRFINMLIGTYVMIVSLALGGLTTLYRLFPHLA